MSNNTDALVEALTDGEYEYVPVEELHEHPKNEEVYGEIDPDESFVDDIRRNGVETPLIVNDHEDTEAEWGLPNTVIGGHRRLEAARRVGLNAVPVRWKSYPEPLATRRLILNNHQRTKNDAQLAREMLMLEGATREMARKNQSSAGGSEPGSLRPNSDEADESVRWDKEIGDELGVGKNKVRYTTDVFRFARPDEYVHDDLQNPEKYDVDEEVRELARKKVEQMEAGKESAHSAYAEIKNLKEEKAKQRRRSERLSSYEDSGESVEVRTGDFRSVLDQESAESIDHIITDPPYDEDALELWAPLSEHAARVLKPGGFLVAYSGKAHLPAVHDALSSHLNYHWQAVVRHAGAGAKIFSRKLRTNYKPVLIYTKGDADLQDDFISDVIEGGGREKDDHDWQQAESEAAKLIESFTEVNDRICDPMCGSGTIAVAADRLDRRCLLIDEDSSAIDTVRERVME